MPSGGLVANWNVRALVADLRAGLGRLTVRQYRFLASQGKRSAIVAVGDVYCLALSLVASKRPTIFVATAKSNYVAQHSALERAVARRAVMVFARDAPTAQSLRDAGVRAQYAGNVMMDGLEATGLDLGASSDAVRFGVLPGSRADAPAEAAAAVQRLTALAATLAARGKNVEAFFSLAPSVEAASVQRAIRAAGVAISDPIDGFGVVARGARGTLRITLVRGAFADLLQASEVVLGQAGTGNEQAAGFGRPVLAAMAPGETAERMRWYRMRQKRLLGDALLVLPAEPGAFAAEVIRLLDDPERMRRMEEAGRERMGGPGGARAVASAVLSLAHAAGDCQVALGGRENDDA
jgi:tetraacyldisaccharide 4'-kinase